MQLIRSTVGGAQFSALIERLEWLGRLLAETGRVDEAVDSWREAVDLRRASFSLGRAVDGARPASVQEDIAQAVAECGGHDEAHEPAKDSVLLHRF
ncbi:tetratricopeptide repeat protein [Actinacidiphila bryophytorum]|uniref:tetratricopeptide repeat protein n=1 Tax=Actinacidiphila bryophytorum TaxID=1436133 RepID=UPI0019605725|nr:tetratricopeptide repeat protein [Actinacidiphila bryophytorum]MBM9436827.1 tetratricopeptide repeat protein [Actinacidiphila bryophytorum]MBN6542330.1 tetratricopeptide repeat protein [Actinacidiphila bryophytorum]